MDFNMLVHALVLDAEKLHLPQKILNIENKADKVWNSWRYALPDMIQYIKGFFESEE